MTDARRRPMGTGGATLLAIAAILFGVGCNDSGNASGAALTQSEFEQRMSQIVTDTNEKLQARGDEYFQGGGAERPTERGFVEVVLTPVLRDAIAEIEALNPPEDQRGEVATMLVAARDALDTVTENPQLIKAPEGSENDPFREFTGLVQSYREPGGG